MDTKRKGFIARLIPVRVNRPSTRDSDEKWLLNQAPMSGKPEFLTSPSNRFDRWLARQMLALVGNPPIVVKLWDDVEVSTPVANPVALMRYGSRKAMWKTILNSELYWGDLYSNGEIEFEGDLPKFIEMVFCNFEDSQPGLLRRFIHWLAYKRVSNPQEKAQQNIFHHYDISNEFYEMWLDTEEMQYTCAYFPDPDNMTLEEAQVAKLHHVCRKLQLKPGDSVVEAGCGWGGLARFMARHYGVNVKAYNISREQVAYARQQAELQGLSGQVEYVLDDYRNIGGKFDVFVSVGMLEHVGPPDYRVLGSVVDRCLRPEGRGLIHSVGRNKPMPMNTWLERRIFPGAHPPSLREMMDIFEPNGLSVLDVENLRLHYALTLHNWLERFEAHRDTVADMMSEEFVRAWRLYLAGTAAAFRSGNLQLFQVVFSRTRNNEIPWSREHVYSRQTGNAAKTRKVEVA